MKPLVKIGIVGPESTGKSTLSEALAAHYNTDYVPEAARKYITELNRSYHEEDLLKIANLQCKTEDLLSKNATGILICDTTLLVICIWSKVKYNRIQDWIREEEISRKYDFYLLTDIDLPWEDDPQREHPHLRSFLFELYKESLINKNVPFEIINGQGENRLKKAIQYIDKMIGVGSS